MIGGKGGLVELNLQPLFGKEAHLFGYQMRCPTMITGDA